MMLDDMTNNWLKGANGILDYIQMGAIIGFTAVCLWFIKSIFRFFMVMFFGPDMIPDYREGTGALCFIGITTMIIKHLIDATYSPDINLLGFCGIVVLALAGIEKGGELIAHYTNKKYSKSPEEKEEPKVPSL